MRSQLALILALLLTSIAGCRAGPPRRIPRIDVNVRVHPQAYDRLLRVMDDVGLHRTINLDGGPPGDVLATLIDLGELSHGRILSLTNVDWRDVDAADFGSRAARDLERAVRLGARGLMIDKALGLGVSTRDGKLLAIDDARLDPLWAKAADLKVPVFLQTAGAAAYFLPVDRSNPQLKELRLAPQRSYADARFPRRQALLAQREAVLQRHPRTRFVCLDFASQPSELSKVAALLDAFPHVSIDTAGALGSFASYDRQTLRGFFARYQDRILFGSGLAMGTRKIELGTPAALTPQEATAVAFYRKHWKVLAGQGMQASPTPLLGTEKINALGLPQQVLEKIYLRNAERLFGLQAEPEPQ